MKHKILLLILLVTKACIINVFGEDFDEKKHPDMRELSPVQVTDIPSGDIPMMEKLQNLPMIPQLGNQMKILRGNQRLLPQREEGRDGTAHLKAQD